MGTVLGPRVDRRHDRELGVLLTDGALAHVPQGLVPVVTLVEPGTEARLRRSDEIVEPDRVLELADEGAPDEGGSLGLALAGSGVVGVVFGGIGATVVIEADADDGLPGCDRPWLAAIDALERRSHRIELRTDLLPQRV